jgi:hypothetical protein
MGTRGPAPRREAEVRRTNNKGKAEQLDREQLQTLPFEVDVDPEPPAMPDHWLPMIKEFWASLLRDPARKWMTSADWGAALLHFESMHRDLAPQVVGVTEQGEVVKDIVPIKGANLGAYQKFLATIGVGEANRLRIQKEITMFPRPATLADGENVIDIRSAREGDVQ